MSGQNYPVYNPVIGVVVGDDRLNDPGLRFDVYLNSDAADDPVLDQVAEQLRTVLVPFSQFEVASAPPGMQLRKESTNAFCRC